MSEEELKLKFLEEIRREREKTNELELKANNIQSELQTIKAQNIHASCKLKQIVKESKCLQQQVDNIKANSLNMEEKNSDYIDQIELALTDIQYGDMSFGDLNRLRSIYLNELSRVNNMIAKLTNHK